MSDRFPRLVGTGSSDNVGWELWVLRSGSPPSLSFSLRTTDEVSGFAGAFGTGLQTLTSNDSNAPGTSIGSTLVGGPPNTTRRVLVVELARAARDVHIVYDDGAVLNPEVLEAGNGLPNFLVAPLRSLPLTIECAVLGDTGGARPERRVVPAVPGPELRTDGPTGGPPRPRVVERRIPPSGFENTRPGF